MEGILVLDKPSGLRSFSLVSLLRRLTKVKKIGHAGTLDPIATGVMIMLIGKTYTSLSSTFLHQDKSYQTKIFLGKSTTTYDTEGEETSTSTIVPSIEMVKKAIDLYQGDISQTPPPFSAKKYKGKKYYEYARKGIFLTPPPEKKHLKISLIDYQYPYLHLDVKCSSGTYIRSLAHDIGQTLGCGGHIEELRRTSSGVFTLEQCHRIEELKNSPQDIKQKLLTKDMITWQDSHAAL